MAYGAACGWPSAAYAVLSSKDTPLKSGPMTMDELSWMVSLLSVGGFFGNILFGCITNRFGRKLPLLSMAIPMTISWCLISYATSPIYLYVARLLSGFGGAGACIFMPLFVTEISEDSVRGSLGSLLVLSCYIGVLFAFIIGNYLSYSLQPIVHVSLPIIFVIAFAFFPESPQHLMRVGKKKEAEESLRFYRNVRPTRETEIFKFELKELRTSKQMLQKTVQDAKLTLADLFSQSRICEVLDFVIRIFRDYSHVRQIGDKNASTTVSARKAITIGVVLSWLNQCCGCYTMLNYTAKIFETSGSILTPNMSAVVVGIIQLIGAYISTFLVDRAGRKILFTISSGGIAISLSCLGSYSYLQTLGFTMDGWSWIPIASFSFCIFIGSWGVLTLPFVVIAEIMPEKIRGIGTAFCIGSLWIFAFMVTKYFPILSDSYGMHGCLAIFACCSVIGCLFSLFVLPETKGKSLEEISRMLER